MNMGCSNQTDKPNKENNENGGVDVACNRNAEEISALLPAEAAEYFRQTESKHFDPETAIGSRFTGVHSLWELLELAQTQRGTLAGDDRHLLMKMGVPETYLLPICRYLLVHTPGKVGIISVDELRDDETVYAKRTKTGVPCTLYVVRDTLPDTDIATIIIGPNEDENSSTKEMIWTAHPGLPIPPATREIYQDGDTLTVSDLRNENSPLAGRLFLNVMEKPKGN